MWKIIRLKTIARPYYYLVVQGQYRLDTVGIVGIVGYFNFEVTVRREPCAFGRQRVKSGLRCYIYRARTG